MTSPYSAASYAAQLDNQSPRSILQHAASHFQQIALSFSGAEDVVLIDMLHKLGLLGQVQVFSLDTGRLHAETYAFMEKVREHYGLAIEVLFPEAARVEAMVRDKGLFSFYQDGHQECCGIRKVGPLRRKLGTLDAWITGQRKDQSPTRSDLDVVEQDMIFGTAEQPLIKFNPLANWTSAQVWSYIEAHQVPHNALHLQGMISIGCEPCTRSTRPNEHERAGRWWWEEATHRECGLHAGNKGS
jgi:phosphoadenosine phosphosulfate reductase